MNFLKYKHNGNGFTIKFKKFDLIDYYKFESHWFFHFLGKGIKVFNLKEAKNNSLTNDWYKWAIKNNVFNGKRFLFYNIKISKNLIVK